MKPWYIFGARTLSLKDKIKLLFGHSLYVRFDSPDGECHAACELRIMVARNDIDKITWPQLRGLWMKYDAQEGGNQA
jgi:hypothetical protein